MVRGVPRGSPGVPGAYPGGARGVPGVSVHGTVQMRPGRRHYITFFHSSNLACIFPLLVRCLAPGFSFIHSFIQYIKGSLVLGPYGQAPLSHGRPPLPQTLGLPRAAPWPIKKGSVLDVYRMQRSRGVFGILRCNERIRMYQLRPSGAVNL